MILNLEHIGIAVKDVKNAEKVFTKLFGKQSYKVENVASENVSTMFYKVGNVKVELLEATNENSAISKFIDKKGEGIHHLAFETDDITAEIERLKQEDFTVLNDPPKKGADNKMISFLHPKSTNGVLIELCQEISEEKG